MNNHFMNWKKIWFGLIAIGIPVVLLAQSIKWYNDAAIPQKTTLAGNEVMSLQQTGPNAYRWALLSDLKRYVGASNVTIITTNNVVYGSNYYVNNTYVSNYFETNILNNTVVSNYFFDFIYYTNIYQTNVTVNQYVSSDTYVSNFITTNIYNDTYTSNYFTTNLFPTTYVYVTNTIGGAFIANWGGMGTNTAFYGGTMFGSQLPNRLLRLDSLGFLDTLPNGTGILTNDGFGGLAWEPLPASSAQVWTNSFPQGFIIPGYDGINTNSVTIDFSGAPLVTAATLTAIRKPTNACQSDWAYVSLDVAVEARARGGKTNAEAVGLFGWTDVKAINARGVVGFVDCQSENSTNIALSGMVATEGKAGIFVAGYDEIDNPGYGDSPVFTESAVRILDNRQSDLPLLIARTNNNSVVARLSEKGVWTGNGYVAANAGIYYGDGSGLTNLNVQTVPNLTVTSNIYYLNAKATNVTWAGPTNTLDFSLGTVQSYATAGPISITNVIGEMTAYQNSTILCISNSSANVITNTLTATGWKLGRFDTLVCTNAGVIQIWLQNIGGMKTVAVREYP